MRFLAVAVILALCPSCKKGGEVIVGASNQVAEGMTEGIRKRQEERQQAREADAKAKADAKDAAAKADAWDPGTQAMPPGMKKGAN